MVYRNRRDAVSFLGWSALIAGVGVLCNLKGETAVEPVNSRDDSWVWFIFGAGFAMIGMRKLGASFRVDADGLTRYTWFGIGNQFHPWDSLHCWNVAHKDNDESRYWCVEFEYVGKTWLFWVTETDVGFPAIHEFIHDIRNHVGSKERVRQSETVKA